MTSLKSPLKTSLAVAAALAVAAVLLGGNEALACAVCGTAKAPNDWAFGLTTALLSFMPPVIFGSVVFFIVRAHKKAGRDESSTIAKTISTPD